MQEQTMLITGGLLEGDSVCGQLYLCLVFTHKYLSVFFSIAASHYLSVGDRAEFSFLIYLCLRKLIQNVLTKYLRQKRSA